MSENWQEKYRDTRDYYLVYSMLIQAARVRGTVTYQEIAEVMGLATRGSHMGKEVGNMIGTISANELRCGRPFLSAIVIGVNGKPGEGLYGYAEELGSLEPDEDRELWWERAKKEIYETWQKRFD